MKYNISFNHELVLWFSDTDGKVKEIFISTSAVMQWRILLMCVPWIRCQFSFFSWKKLFCFNNLFNHFKNQSSGLFSQFKRNLESQTSLNGAIEDEMMKRVVPLAAAAEEHVSEVVNFKTSWCKFFALLTGVKTKSADWGICRRNKFGWEENTH